MKKPSHTFSVRLRGPLKGICNICQNYDDLTYDHIPPKGSFKAGAVELRSLHETLGVKYSAPGLTSQDGIKYRTICSSCNNDRLGIRCDPTLNKFVSDVRLALPKKIQLPSNYDLCISSDIDVLIKAIVGHWLAIGLDYTYDGAMNKKLAEYFMGLTNIPSELSVFCWLYPHKGLVLVKNAVLMNLKWGEHGVHFGLIKFFPLAFMLVWERTPAISFHMTNLVDLLSEQNGGHANVKFKLSPIIDRNWPERVTDNASMIFHGDDTVVASQRPRRSTW